MAKQTRAAVSFEEETAAHHPTDGRTTRAVRHGADLEARTLDTANRADVQRRVLEWYRTHGRDLPWRHTHDPYAILVAEIMLQQTGVERVLPKYAEFLHLFPSLEALAAASTGAVIRAWAGLGYNSRAVRLQGIARQISGEFGGAFPTTVDELRCLGGIGPYTAGAIACFAFNRQVAFLDTNIRRVLLRVFVGPDQQVSRDRVTEREAQQIAQSVLPDDEAYDWHQALMDLGSQICTVYNPTCLLCPVGQLCRSFGCATAPVIAASITAEGGLSDVADSRIEPRVKAVREDGPVWTLEAEMHSVARSSTAIKPARRKPKEVPFVGSTRYFRGRIIAALRDVPPGETLSLDTLGVRVKPEYRAAERDWLADLVRQLAAAGLLAFSSTSGGAATSEDDSAELEKWQISLP